jgi:hypothetical protein
VRRIATGSFTAKNPIGFAGGYANLYKYVDNDPVNAIDPTGLRTIQVGITINIQVGPFSGTYSQSVAIDARGNIGVVRTYGGVPDSAVAHALLAGSQLLRPFSYGSLGAGEGLPGSVDGFSGNNPNGWGAGGGFTVGVGVGAGGSTGVTHATVTPIGRLW